MSLGHAIGVMTPSGQVTEYPLPALASPVNITVGPDNNLWFTDPGTDSVGMITTAGKYTEYKLPSITADPDGIVTDPQDGNLWVTEEFDGKIAEISPQGQVLIQYTVAGNFPQPTGITVGPDGNIWFAETGGQEHRRAQPRQQSDHPIPRPGHRSPDSRDHVRTRRQPLVHGSTETRVSVKS